jgi:para-nitrobenzyl esterase
MRNIARTLLRTGALLGLCLLVRPAIAQPISIDGGKITGVPGRDPRITIFRGIPYAAPPVGALRWRPPQPVIAWSGTKAAREVGPACIGRNFGAAGSMSEDCLYLNVWTPTATPGARLPVLVWIHGGGFQGGSGYHPSYEGEAFAKQGVVVVTFNYRVGLFGFLAHPDLSRESAAHASGNYGLLDQVAAINWVQRNIAQFGGDPKRVTIAGESAGSYSVSALTASPMVRGLFRAAIAESGAYLGPKPDAMRSLAKAETMGLEFGKSLGAGGISDLRAMSSDALMRAVEKLPDFFAFQPCVDGFFLKEPVYQTYAKHQQARVPILIGSNTDEGAFLLPLRRASAAELQAQINKIFGAKAGLVGAAYPMTAADEVVRAELNLAADDGFNYPMWKWATMHGRDGFPVYYYLFGRVLPSLPGQTYKGIAREKIGAFHGDEVPYVFGDLNLVTGALDGAPRAGRWEAVDFRLSDTMLGYWANFVKTGDPNSGDLPKWSRYDSGNSLMRFFDGAEVHTDDRIARMKMLDAAFTPDSR